MKIKKELEDLIGLIETSMQEQGYITKRYSQTNGEYGTTSYDCIIVRDENGKEYTLSINERNFYNRELGRWEASNDLANEASNIMKFYEFDSSDFGYYALIGANSEEEAINFYEEQVGDIEDKDICPDEISKEQAKKKLLHICQDNDQETRAKGEFAKYTHGTEPYLILIDGSLL